MVSCTIFIVTGHVAINMQQERGRGGFYKHGEARDDRVLFYEAPAARGHGRRQAPPHAWVSVGDLATLAAERVPRRSDQVRGARREKLTGSL